MDTTTIRIDEKLVKEAKQIEKKTRRKAPRQIEHWAEIGKRLEEKLNSSEIAALLEGKAHVKVESESAGLSMLDVASELANDRKEGKLFQAFKGKDVFEASKEIPGSILRIKPDGTKEIGNFVKGKFTARIKSK